MKKRVVLITGATSGIGRALAISLAKEWQIIVVGRYAKKLEALTKIIQETGGVCEPYKMNLASQNSIALTSRHIKANHTHLDWIINNAGTIEEKKDTLKLSETAFLHTLQVNLLAPYQLIRSLWPILEKGEGGVVNISSTAGLHGNPDFPAYSASKAGLITLSESLARSALFQDKKKYVLNVIPGATNTPMRERVAQDAAKQQSTQVITDWLNTTLKNKQKLQRLQNKRILIRNNRVTIDE